MKAYLEKETAVYRAVNALLGKTAATFTSKLAGKLGRSTPRRKSAQRGHSRRRGAVPRCQRMMLVKGGVRHG